MLKFTIVTVCYNAQAVIEKTMRSVLEQTYEEFEYLIIDGDSADSTLKIVNTYSENAKLKIFTGKDYGIYNAMNRGIAQASGDYIFFLNAGDAFYEQSTLEKAANYINDTKTIYYGRAMIYSKSGKHEIADFANMPGNVKDKLYKGSMPCHQAVFAPRESLTNHYFREKYKIRADYEWFMYCICHEYQCVALPFTVSYFDKDGMSGSIKNQILVEKETQEIIKEYLWAVGKKQVEYQNENLYHWKTLLNKYFGMYSLTIEWLERKQKGENIGNQLLIQGWKNIAIYGMGDLGKCLLKELGDSEVRVSYLIDKNADNLLPDHKDVQIRICKPESDLETVDAIVVTAVFYYDDICKELSKKIDCPVISLEDLIKGRR